MPPPGIDAAEENAPRAATIGAALMVAAAEVREDLALFEFPWGEKYDTLHEIAGALEESGEAIAAAAADLAALTAKYNN